MDMFGMMKKTWGMTHSKTLDGVNYWSWGMSHSKKKWMVLTAEVEECHTVKNWMVLTAECVWLSKDGKILKACHETETLTGDKLLHVFYLDRMKKHVKHATGLKQWMVIIYWVCFVKKHLRQVLELKHGMLINYWIFRNGDVWQNSWNMLQYWSIRCC